MITLSKRTDLSGLNLNNQVRLVARYHNRKAMAAFTSGGEVDPDLSEADVKKKFYGGNSPDFLFALYCTWQDRLESLRKPRPTHHRKRKDKHEKTGAQAGI